MFKVASLIGWAAHPCFSSSFQLACDKDLKRDRIMSWCNLGRFSSIWFVIFYMWLTEFLGSCLNMNASSFNWSVSDLVRHWNWAFDPFSFASVRHLTSRWDQNHTHFLLKCVCLSLCMCTHLPMVFYEVISGQRCCIRFQSGNTAVNEELSGHRSRVAVGCFKVQNVPKVEDVGRPLTFPVICT